MPRPDLPVHLDRLAKHWSTLNCIYVKELNIEVCMRSNVPLVKLLSVVPVHTRQELLSFLAFSDREANLETGEIASELLVSLSFFNAATLRPN